MAKKTNKGGNTRRRPSAGKNLIFRPGPLRQLLFVGLALGGIGIGYGAGFLLKKEQPANLPVQAPVAATTPAIITTPPVPESKPPLLPEDSNPAPGEPPRAYEEALPREIIVHTRPVEENQDKKKTEEVAKMNEMVAAASENPVEKDMPPQAPVKAPEITAPKTLKTDKEEIAAVLPVPVGKKPLPRIVLVIDDLGVDKSRTARTIQLPGPLTLSFLTYANGLGDQTRAAREAGHELWMHIPMEPGSTDVDPGPNVLLTGTPEAELLNSLNWNLEQFSGYVGINNHMGSRFTADRTGMLTLMKELKKRGLFFLDSVTSGKTVGRKVARAAGVPFASRNVFLDHQDDVRGIEKRLKEVEKLARQTGAAIAIGHPREATLKALIAWLDKIEGRGFRLVPLSAVIKNP